MSKRCEDCGEVNDTPEYDICSSCFEDKAQPLFLTRKVEELSQEFMALTGEPVAEEMNHILYVELGKRIRRYKQQRDCSHPEHRRHVHKGEEWCTECNKYLGYVKK